MDITQETLRLLAEDGRLTPAEIAARLDSTEKQIQAVVSGLENNGTIVGYRALFDDSILPENAVKAIIEVKTIPERDGGFDRIAKRISKFPKVQSMYLMSGSFDLLIEVRGESLNDVAEFVSSKLATIRGVTSTATHFLLKKYKESGKLLQDDEEHERLNISL